MTALTYEAWTTEDGDLWAAFVYGHHDLDLIASETVVEMLVARVETETMLDGDDAREYLAGCDPAHLWIYNRYESEETGDPDFAWRFCDAGTSGAVAITGWRGR